MPKQPMVHHLQLADIDSTGGSSTPLLTTGALETPWRALDHLCIAPGSEHRRGGADGPAEYGYLLLEGDIELRAGAANLKAHAPAVLRTVEPDHALANDGSGSARLLALEVRVATLPSPGPEPGAGTAVAVADPRRLQWRAAIHGGAGRIATRHIWGPDDLASTWTFLDHAILAANSSVGYHHHEGLDESFVILAGKGYVTVEGSCFEVGPGSVTLQRIGQGHGIFNPSHEAELSFIRIAVAGVDGTFDTIDRDDDLVGRLPCA